MGIPLREIMKTYPFSENILIAGELGIDRIVNSCNIQEVPEVEKWIQKGEILFSAGYAMKDIEDTKEFLYKLNANGVAAIVLKLGPYLPNIPDYVVDYCDDLELPLFQMPEDTPYMSCILPIFERITNKQLWLLQKAEKIHEDMLKNIISGGGLDGICHILSTVSDSDTILYLPTGSVMAKSGGLDNESIQVLDEGLLRFLATINRKQWYTVPFQKVKLQGETWLCMPIQANNEMLAYLLQRFNGNADERSNILILSQSAQLIALEIIQNKILDKRECQIAEQLFEDILLQRYKDKNIILKRGRHLKINLNQPYVIFKIYAEIFEGYLTSQGRYTDEQHIHIFKQNIRNITRALLSEKVDSFLLMEDGVGMNGMIEINKQCNIKMVDEILRELLKNFEEEMPELEFLIGLSQETFDITEAEVALEEAQKAIQVCRRRNDEVKILKFSDLGSLVSLSELSTSESLISFINDQIGEIDEYDRNNDGALMATLDAYLKCDGHLQRTADSLFVHKNTVIYRMKKIKTMTNLDLSDYRTLFDLHLCMLMRDFV